MQRNNLRILGGLILLILLLLLLLLWLFTPFLGGARLGPMRGIGPFRGMGPMSNMGPMSFGMMRQVHGMGDVESEYEFLVNMIPHHQEAVDKARVLEERTNREEMRTFAGQIIETQSTEIDQMNEWLDRWYPDRAHEVAYEPMMSDYSQLAGEDLDRLFLQEMIPHHMAAVIMSQQLLARNLAEHQQVAELAATIRANQLAEIEQMGRWLDRWAR